MLRLCQSTDHETILTSTALVSEEYLGKCLLDEVALGALAFRSSAGQCC